METAERKDRKKEVDKNSQGTAVSSLATGNYDNKKQQRVQKKEEEVEEYKGRPNLVTGTAGKRECIYPGCKKYRVIRGLCQQHHTEAENAKKKTVSSSEDSSSESEYDSDDEDGKDEDKSSAKSDSNMKYI